MSSKGAGKRGRGHRQGGPTIQVVSELRFGPNLSSGRYAPEANFRQCFRRVAEIAPRSMADHIVVFDGTPAQLTIGMAREIYGAEAEEAFNEAATSTSLSAGAAAPAPELV